MPPNSVCRMRCMCSSLMLWCQCPTQPAIPSAQRLGRGGESRGQPEAVQEPVSGKRVQPLAVDLRGLFERTVEQANLLEPERFDRPGHALAVAPVAFGTQRIDRRVLSRERQRPGWHKRRCACRRHRDKLSPGKMIEVRHGSPPPKWRPGEGSETAFFRRTLPSEPPEDIAGASPTPAFSQGTDDSAEPLCRFFSKCEIPISVSAIVYIGTQILVKQPH